MNIPMEKPGDILTFPGSPPLIVQSVTLIKGTSENGMEKAKNLGKPYSYVAIVAVPA